MTRKSQHPAVPDAQRGVIRAGDANHLLEVLLVLFLFMEGFWLSDHIAQYRKKRSSTNSQPASGIHPSSSFHEKIGILKWLHGFSYIFPPSSPFTVPPPLGPPGKPPVGPLWGLAQLRYDLPKLPKKRNSEGPIPANWHHVSAGFFLQEIGGV